jgi:hypothetical protein
LDWKVDSSALQTGHSILVLCLTRWLKANAATLCYTSQSNYATCCGRHGWHTRPIRSTICHHLTFGITGFLDFAHPPVF